MSNWPKASFPTITKEVNLGREELKSPCFPHLSALRFEHENTKAILWSWHYLQSLQKDSGSTRRRKKAREWTLSKRSTKAIQTNIIPLVVKDLKYAEHWSEMEDCIHQQCSMSISHKKVISVKQRTFCAIDRGVTWSSSHLRNPAHQWVRSMNPSGSLWPESGIVWQGMWRIGRGKGNESAKHEKIRAISSYCSL